MQFPDINNDFNSYQRMIEYYHDKKELFFETLDIKLAGWFSANSCSMLGAILSKLQDNLNVIHVDAGNARNILERNGFLSFFGHEKTVDINNTTISYQHLSPEDDRYFNNYVMNEFLNKPDLPDMTKTLKRKLAESIYEIFINAKMHSGSDKIFTCGQFFPKRNEIEFMITDIGIGIREVVNRRFNTNLSSVQAIKWAITEGHTTKQGVSGGIGFSILGEFIEKNRGKIQIISNDGFWESSVSQVSTKFFKHEFPGTVVNISVRTDDDAHYSLVDEPIGEIF